MFLFLLKGAAIIIGAILIIGFGLPMFVGSLEIFFGAGSRKPKISDEEDEDEDDEEDE